MSDYKPGYYECETHSMAPAHDAPCPWCRLLEMEQRELALAWALDERVYVQRATNRRFYAYRSTRLGDDHIVGAGDTPSEAIGSAIEAKLRGEGKL